MPSRSSIRLRRLLFACLLGLCIVALSACEWTDLINGDDDDNDGGGSGDNTPPATETNVPGLSVAVSGSGFETTLANVRSAIGDRGNMDIVDTVDHQDNADGAGEDLRPTTVILFDNPNRSSALIAADPRVALDLPMRMLVYRDGSGVSNSDNTGNSNNGTGTGNGVGTGNDNNPSPGIDSDAGTGFGTTQAADRATSDNNGMGDNADATAGNVAVAYNNAAYLGARYDLTGAEQGTLNAFDQDLQAIATQATGDTPSAGAATGITRGQGIKRFGSDNDFDTTVAQLSAAIDKRSDLTLIQTIDFQSRGGSGALNPSSLFIFGNPDVGTGFLQSSQTVGVDLPQKMLVAAGDNGQVTIYYNDPGFIADRHNIDNRDAQVRQVTTLLRELAREATGESTGDNGSTDTDTDTGTDTGNTDNGDAANSNSPDDTTQPDDSEPAAGMDDAADDGATDTQTTEPTP